MREVGFLALVVATGGCYLDTDVTPVVGGMGPVSAEHDIGGGAGGGTAGWEQPLPQGGSQAPPGSEELGDGGTGDPPPSPPSPGDSGSLPVADPTSINDASSGDTAVVDVPDPEPDAGTDAGAIDVPPVSQACIDLAPGDPMGKPWNFAPAFDCAQDGSIPCDGALVEADGGNAAVWCGWQLTDSDLNAPASDVVMWGTYAPTMVVAGNKCTRVELGDWCAVWRGKDLFGASDTIAYTYGNRMTAPGWVVVHTASKVGGQLEGACTIGCP